MCLTNHAITDGYQSLDAWSEHWSRSISVSGSPIPMFIVSKKYLWDNSEKQPVIPLNNSDQKYNKEGVWRWRESVDNTCLITRSVLHTLWLRFDWLSRHAYKPKYIVWWPVQNAALPRSLCTATTFFIILPNEPLCWFQLCLSFSFLSVHISNIFSRCFPSFPRCHEANLLGLFLIIF